APSLGIDLDRKPDDCVAPSKAEEACSDRLGCVGENGFQSLGEYPSGLIAIARLLGDQRLDVHAVEPLDDAAAVLHPQYLHQAEPVECVQVVADPPFGLRESGRKLPNA